MPKLKTVAWRQDGFSVLMKAYETAESHRLGWEYIVADGSEVIFSGTDFSTHTATTPQQAMISLLGVCVLQPGDTDAEHFEQYSDFQTAWMESERCDALADIHRQLEDDTEGAMGAAQLASFMEKGESV
jgi:hypothetical protein